MTARASDATAEEIRQVIGILDRLPGHYPSDTVRHILNDIEKWRDSGWMSIDDNAYFIIHLNVSLNGS